MCRTLLLLSLFSFLGRAPQAATETLRSSTEAISLARQYLGLGKWEGESAAIVDSTVLASQVHFNAVASLTMPGDDRTPFLHDLIVADECWCVRFDSVKLGSADTSSRAVDVFLEKRSGRLLKIESKYPDLDSTLQLPATAAEAEAVLRHAGESYRLPDTAPALSLHDIADSALGGSVHAAQEFSAVYVIWSDLVSKDVPVWIVTMRGITPVPMPGRRGQDVPISMASQLRFVIDANTGKRLVSTNYPLPRVPEN